MYFAAMDTYKRGERGDIHNSKTIAVPLKPRATWTDPNRTISDGAYRIEPAERPSALTVEGRKEKHGTPVGLSRWQNRNKQRWLVTHLGDGEYRLEVAYNAVEDQKVLAAQHQSGSSSSKRTLVQATWSDERDERQLWRIRENEDGTYRLINRRTGTVAEVTGDDGQNDRVTLSEWEGRDRQKWHLNLPMKQP